MKWFGWILVGLGVLLAASAFVTIIRAARGNAKGRRVQESIGCGFIMLAGFVWGYAFGLLLNDWSRGLQVGFGIAFLLSAVAAAVRPGPGALMRGLIPLVLAALLLGPVLPDLAGRFSGEEAQTWTTKLERRSASLEEQLAKAENYVRVLTREESELRETLREQDLASYDAVVRDEAAYARLRELAEVRDLLTAAEERVEVLKANRDRVQAALRRVRRLSVAEDVLDMDIGRDEIRRILDESGKPEERAVGTVETHLESDRLRDLFEQTVGTPPAGEDA